MTTENPSDKPLNYVKLSDNLVEFPGHLFDWSETLETIDLSNNRLTQLPADFWKFKKLKILFLSNNEFVEFPEVLKYCPQLDIVGFKANKIAHVPEHSIPENLRWLILTGNQIGQLPTSIGNCKRLQKVMLAGNRLTHLPDEMQNCTEIQLLRISANCFKQLPAWLFGLPKLTWLAFAGNDLGPTQSSTSVLPEENWQDFRVAEKLGYGASGDIFKAHHVNQEASVAIKIFKAEITSDGWPLDEMVACTQIGSHPNLIKALATITNHPEEKKGVVFELIPPSYKNLGQPPNFVTCTRDTFPTDAVFSMELIIKISTAIASAMYQLHDKGIMHGDLYAHNILVNSDGHALLSDFGAATRYYGADSYLAHHLERLDIRAFGFLLDDLLCRASETTSATSTLTLLRDMCLEVNQANASNFAFIENTLSKLLEK
jgi:hypothetical protein